MNLLELFQNLVAQVPVLAQPLIVALAGAVPFIEGEGAAVIGILGGIHPAIAAIAAIAGNFLCVTVLVLVTARARAAVVNRRRVRELVTAAGEVVVDDAPLTAEEQTEQHESARKLARKEKFQRSLERYGVPGVSLLGPLLLPTQFTSTMLAGIGIRTGRILFWQAVAIIGWTTLLSLVATGVIGFAS